MRPILAAAAAAAIWALVPPVQMNGFCSDDITGIDPYARVEVVNPYMLQIKVVASPTETYLFSPLDGYYYHITQSSSKRAHFELLPETFDPKVYRYRLQVNWGLGWSDTARGYMRR